MKLKAMTLALFAAGLLAGLTLISPATGADSPTTTTSTTTPATTTTQTNYTTATDAITALSSTSITVGPLTCSINSSSPTAGDFKVGNRVRMYCANGVLFSIKADTTLPATTTTTTTPVTTTTATTTTTPSTNYTYATDAISALSATSITVGPLTCSIGVSPKAGDFKVGNRVRMYCANGVLYSIKADTPLATTTTTTTPPTTTTTTPSTSSTTATDPISALSSTSITVGPLTCSINSSSPKTGDFKIGDRALIYCVGGVLAHLLRPDAPPTTTTPTSDHHDDLTTRLGTISALSSASITVDGLTCSIGDRSPSVTGFKVGDQVGIGCTGGVLAKIGTPQVDDSGFKVVVQLGSITALSADSITVGKVTCSVAASSPSVASFKVGDRVGVGCAGGILFMIGVLPSTDHVSKSTVKNALVQRFHGCIKRGAEKCTVKDVLHRLAHK